MKITIQTDQGPHDISPAYETAVHGLVAHRAHTAPEWWVLTHLASGWQFGVALSRLTDVRRCVRTVLGDLGNPGWGGRVHPRNLSAAHRVWGRRYLKLAEACPKHRLAPRI